MANTKCIVAQIAIVGLMIPLIHAGVVFAGKCCETESPSSGCSWLRADRSVLRSARQQPGRQVQRHPAATLV